ncbi:hypothetical protein GYMLUDRAFT_123169, partial [Collybiopsis luxurians FD-317 M1]
PDGGFRAWATLIGGFCVVMVTFGYTNSFGVYQDWYTRSHNASPSAVSWVGSTQLCFLIAMGLPSGKLLDLGYFHYILPAGSILYTFSLFMVSLIHPESYYQIFLSQGLGMGIGGGMIYMPAIAIQAHHWSKYCHLAVALVAMGGSIGGIVFPIFLNQLFHSSIGYAWGVRSSAFIVGGLLLLSNLLMRDNPDIVAVGRQKKQSVRMLFKDLPYIIYTIAMCFQCIKLHLLREFAVFYIQLYAVLQGVGDSSAFYTLAVMNAASLPGRIIPSFLTPRYGVINVFIIITCACGILNIALLGIQQLSSIMVFSALYGFLSGACKMGLLYSIASLGALVGNPLDGVLLGSTFAWEKAIIFSAVMIFAGSCLLLACRYFLTK